MVGYIKRFIKKCVIVKYMVIFAEANINISRVVRPIYLHLTDSKDESDAVSMKG